MMVSIILSKGRKGFRVPIVLGIWRSFSSSSLKRGFYVPAVPSYYSTKRKRVIPRRRKLRRSQERITNAKHKRVAILEGMRVE